MEDLKWIGERRRRLGLTQQQLARLGGVSQSLVAKIEAGRVDAAYSKVRAIIEALERQQAASEKTAREIMHAGVEAISPSQTLHAAAQAMRRRNISQLPIVEDGRATGSISEEIILGKFSSDPKRMSSLRVSDAMGEAFPAALPSTPISAVATLLRHHPAVLVMEKGRIAGIITKADLLKAI